ncbi:MAG: glycosyltransferase [Bdellovibrionota bacterium]
MKVSIIIPALNEATCIADTVRAVLDNSYRDFELIVVDDGSYDETFSRLQSINDSRLVILKNQRSEGHGRALNRGIGAATGKLVFLTDAHCLVRNDWIEQGVLSFSDPSVVAVEGDITYPFVPTSIRDKVPCNPFYHSFTRRISAPGRDYASGNIAYRTETLRTLGGFNCEQFGSGRGDTELGWRARALGTIVHNPKMIVEHAAEEWTWRSLIKNAARYEKDVLFFREQGFFFFRRGRILHPKLLCFPYLVWKYRRMPLRDFQMLPAFLAYLLLARIFIWRGAWRYGVFVL